MLCLKLTHIRQSLTSESLRILFQGCKSLERVVIPPSVTQIPKSAFKGCPKDMVIVDASDIDGAYLKACYIEELAEMYHHILTVTGGKEPLLLTADEIGGWAYPEAIRMEDN